eukprot:jgi/Tetstr1/445695/TSEL_003497.t3
MARFASPSWAWLLVSLVVLSPCFRVPVLAVDRFELVWNELLESRKALPLVSKRVAEGDADYDRKGKRLAQPPAAEVPSRTINAPEDGWLDKDASSAELCKAITAALALCTTVALRINKRGKKLHVEHEYGAEVAREFDAVDPLGEKGSADNKELKKAIEKVKAKTPSSSSRAKPASSSRKPESSRRGSDNRREGGRQVCMPTLLTLNDGVIMLLSEESREELQFWSRVSRQQFTGRIVPDLDSKLSVFLECDASGIGWGGLAIPTNGSSYPVAKAHGFFFRGNV